MDIDKEILKWKTLARTHKSSFVTCERRVRMLELFGDMNGF